MKIRFNEIVVSLIIFTLSIIIIYFPILPSGLIPERGGPNTTSFKPGDFAAYNVPSAIIVNRALKSEKVFPFYNNFILSGTPFYPKPQSEIFSLRTLLLFIISEYDAVKFSLLLHLLIGAFGIFLLSRCWEIGFSGSIISGIIFISSDFVIGHFYAGHENIINGIAWLPYIIFFYYKTLNGEKLLSIILTSLFLSIQIFEGVDTIFLYTTMIMIIFAVGALLRYLSKKNFVKIFFNGIFIIIFMLCFSAIKLIPSYYFMKISNRTTGLPLNESIIKLNETNIYGIGIVAIILFLIYLIKTLNSVYFYLITKDKNKHCSKIVLVEHELWSAFILGILIGFGTFIYVLLWKIYPGFRFQRIPERAFILSYFSLSIFCGIGFNILKEYLEKAIQGKQNYVKIFKFNKSLFLMIVVSLILCDRKILGHQAPPMFNLEKSLIQNNPFQFISKEIQKEKEYPSRIHVIENKGIDWGIENITVPLAVENIYGYDNLWHNAYLPSLYARSEEIPFMFAAEQNPLKFWSMLNVKFITSTKPINHPEIKLIKEFPDADNPPKAFADLPKSYPKYIYENINCMPRAYFSRHSILFIGDKKQIMPIIYKIMLSEDFDPFATSLIYVEKPEEKALKTTDAVFLFDLKLLEAVRKKFDEYHKGDNLNKFWIAASSKETEAGYLAALNQCRIWKDDNNRKKLVNTNDEDFVTTLTLSRNALKVMERNSHSTKIQIPKESFNKKGFIVLSEKYSLFKGWNAYLDNENEKNRINIFRANGIFTAVSLNEINEILIKQVSDFKEAPSQNEEKILFKYTPQGFFFGALISLFSLLFALLLILIKILITKNF